MIFRILFTACTALGAAFYGAAQEEPAVKTGGRGGGADVRSALEERLRSLEEEEQAMTALSGQLTSGVAIDMPELWKSWLPPAVYLIDIAEPLGGMEITGEAAKIATEMLDQKTAQIDQLLDLKTRLEAGEAVTMAELEKAGGEGLQGYHEALKRYEEEVKKLRDQLEELRFEERFLGVADLSKPLEGEAQPSRPVSISELFPPENERGGEREGEIPAGETSGEGELLPDGLDLDDPHIAVDLFALAETYYRSGHYKQAWVVFEKIDIAAHHRGDLIMYMIARCREKLSDLAGARKAYEEVIKIYPGSFWARQADFAMAVVDWKIELGPVQGAPPEVYRVLGHTRPGKGPEGQDNP